MTQPLSGARARGEKSRAAPPPLCYVGAPSPPLRPPPSHWDMEAAPLLARARPSPASFPFPHCLQNELTFYFNLS